MQFYCFCLKPGLNRLLQQLFGTGFSNALAPTSHARWIDGSLVLEELHSTEALPVRILYPALNHIFIAEVEGVLQVVKRYHQSRTDRRPPDLGAIGRAEKLIESIPLDYVGQLDQPVSGINDAAELDSEQIALPIFLGWFLGFHAL